MPSAEERFRAKVLRRADHEVWLGSTDHRGVGMVRIDGKLRTVQRAAWEFAFGPLPEGARVNTCAGHRACVTLSHLSLNTPVTPPAPRTRRRRKGTGSIREVRPGSWEIAITDPSIQGGRRFATIEGDRRHAEAALERVLESVPRGDLGDLRVGELVQRYLDATSTAERGVTLMREVIAPTLGRDLAALATTAHIERSIATAARDGTPLPDARDAVRLLRRSYQWAIKQGWATEDPTADIETRWLGR